MTDQYENLPPVPQAPQVQQVTPLTTPAAQQTNVTTQNLDGNAQVRNQITSLLDSENPYIKRARARAAETSNSRGLLNSSLAATAGEAAAIDAALPIAQQDAQSFLQQSLQNQQDLNQAAQLDSQAVNEMNRFNAEQVNAIEMRNADMHDQFSRDQYQAEVAQQQQWQSQQNQLETMEQDTLNRERLMERDASIREQLAAVEQQYALDLEELSQSYEIAKNADTAMGAMYDGALRSLATVLQDPNLSGAQRNSAAQVIVGNLQSGLEFLSGISVSPGTAAYQ